MKALAPPEVLVNLHIQNIMIFPVVDLEIRDLMEELFPLLQRPMLYLEKLIQSSLL